MLLLAIVLLLFQGVLTNVGISEQVLRECFSPVVSCVYNSTNNSCSKVKDLSLNGLTSCLTSGFRLKLTQDLLPNVTTATVKVTLDGDINDCENEDVCEHLDGYIEMVLAERNEGYFCNTTILSEDEVRFSCAVPEFSSDGAYVRLYVLSDTTTAVCVLGEIPNAALVLVQDSELIKLHVLFVRTTYFTSIVPNLST